ncbi:MULTISPECIES: TonB-dependent receptor [Acidiphilium]|uniref:TonB-dependent receptor n=1 Tax=Acidiphilium TaxID=522 RepID=UPI00257FFE79|nr:MULTISPECIES: TonB-dependent receptor [Acidiphilium]HQT85990.1 TonB-dependent receptor [Acidiphilium rubrum]
MSMGFSMQTRADAGLRAALMVTVSVASLTSVAMGQAVNAGTVSAQGVATSSAVQLKKADHTLTKKQIFTSTQTKAVISRQQIKAIGPAGGAGQAVSLAPGVVVRGYGGTAATARYEVTLRGVKVGWSSVNGDVERNGITVLFDGIPMNNLTSHNGQWDSNEIPIIQLIGGINVINGPGNPASRWFDSIGGTIDYVPMQPTPKPQFEVGSVVGSNVTFGSHFIANSGLHKGWSVLFAGGYASNHTFRTGTTAGSYGAPAQSNAFLGKVTHVFQGGRLSFGGYDDNNVEHRPSPNFIPTQPIPGITVTGAPTGELYSQPTSGFYSAGVPNVWFKTLQVRDYMLYGKLSLDLAPDLTFHNITWFRHGARVHYRTINYGTQAQGSANTEYYNPNSNTYGDRAYLDWKLPFNDIKLGGYFINQRYVSPYVGYNQALGITQTNPAQVSNFTLYNTFLDAFVQDTITPIPGLKITPGLAGVEYQTDFYNNAYNNPLSTTLSPNAHKTFTNPEPSVGVRYQPVPWGALYGSYAISYQNPTDNGFGANNGNAGGVDIASLKPIKSVDYEIGAKMMFDHVAVLNHATLNVNYFHDTLSNETIATYFTNIALTKFAAANAALKGFNIAATADPNFHWNMFANVGFSNNLFTSYLPSGASTPLVNTPIAYNPNVALSAGINYRMFVGPTLVDLGFLDQYTGSQHLFNNLTDQTSHQKLPAFNVANISLSADIPVPRSISSAVKVLKLSFNINNLFGARYNANAYVSSGGYLGGNSAGAVLAEPGAPRQYLASLTAKF